MSDATSAPVKPTTDNRVNWIRSVILPAALGALVTSAILFVPAAGWQSNDVTTGQHPGYPDLQPRKYDSSPLNTIRVVVATASGLSNWHIVGRDEQKGTVQLEAKALVPIFTDDVLVTVTPTGTNNDSSLVTIRSHSRVGRADLGENARHIRILQAAMDDKLPRLE